MSDEHANKAEVREIAREVARQTVREMREHEVELSAQEKLYVRRAAHGAEQVAIWTRRAIVTAVVSGILWMLWEGFKRVSLRS